MIVIFDFKIYCTFVSECGLFKLFSEEFSTAVAKHGSVSADLACRTGRWGTLTSVLTQAQAALVHRVTTQSYIVSNHEEKTSGQSGGSQTSPESVNFSCK